MTQRQFRAWLQENNVNSYVYANWTRRHNPGKLWFQCNTSENRAAFLADGRNEVNPDRETAQYEAFRAQVKVTQ
jgi:hypothetical protein